MTDKYKTTDGRTVEIDDSALAAATARRLAEMERSDSLYKASSAQVTLPEGDPARMTAGQGGASQQVENSSKRSFIDSGYTDAAVVLGVGLLAVAAAAVAPVAALGLAAAATSLAVDALTHRLRGDKDGILRRPGSLLKAAIAGAAVTIAPVTTIGGVIAAAGAVALSETLISDRPDAAGNLLNSQLTQKLGSLIGIDLSKMSALWLVAIIAGVLFLASRFSSPAKREQHRTVAAARMRDTSVGSQMASLGNTLSNKIKKLTTW